MRYRAVGSGGGGTSEGLAVTLAAGSAVSLDLTAASTFDVTGSAASCLVTPSLGSPSSGRAYAATILLRQDASGNRAWTFPAAVKWASSPLFSKIPNAVDTVTMITSDGGTTYLAYGPTAVAAVNQRDAETFLAWRPTTPAVFAENFPRVLTLAGAAGTPLSGVRNVFLGPKLYAGDVINGFVTIVGSPGSTGLAHSWFSLIDPATLLPICNTADDSAVWTAFLSRQVLMAAPFTVPATKAYYIGLVVQGTTMPQLRGIGGSISEAAEAMVPSINATSDTGLTTPTSTSTPVAALASPTTGTFIPWVGLF